MDQEDFRINEELFVISDKDNTFIIYLPLEGKVIRANPPLIGLLKQIDSGEELPDSSGPIIKELQKFRVLQDKKIKNQFKSEPKQKKYKPLSVTLLPTYDCNLRCLYCYSEAGTNLSETMNLDVARASIDLVIRNVAETDRKNVLLSFHGGGEPFHPSAKGCVEYATGYFKEQAQKANLNPHVSAVTNALLSKKTLEWIISNMDHLSISLDGPEDIQNRQRPTSGNSKSFGKVMRTIHFLNEKNFKYGIRATVTDIGVKRMAETVEFFHSISPQLKSFHFEPLFECGRCRVNPELHPPKPEEFVKYFLQAREFARNIGISLDYSGAKLDHLYNTFCGASGTNFFVLPNGIATMCLEHCRGNSLDESPFFVGQYNAEKKGFVFADSKIEVLRNRTIDKLPKCKDCFAKYSCAGDCLAKVHAQSGDMFDCEGNYRCEINRGILLDELQRKLTNPEPTAI